MKGLARTMLVALTVAAAPAGADQAGDAARKWDLLGVWKNDCRARASRDDPAFRYIVRSGRLLQEREFGDGRDANGVSFAEFAADGSIELTVIFVGGEARTLVLRRETADRLLVWSSRVVGTDTYLIRDGQFTDGNPARPVLTHCSRYGDK